MSNNPELITLDVRGEVCPSPLFKAMEAMRSALTGQSIEMVTDFLPAVLTVTNAALKEGWDIAIKRVKTAEWTVLLTQTDQAAVSS